MKKVLLAAICLILLAPVPVEADEWNYDLALYGWLAGMDGTIGVLGMDGEQVNASFSDLTNFLDFAMAGHAEAKNSRVLLLTDINYVKLGGKREADITGPDGELMETVSVDLDLAQWILELSGGYRVTRELDLLLVGRYYIYDTGVTSSSIAGGSSSGKELDWGDIYLGARYSRMLGKKWFFSVRGDVGTGGSDFAWFANAAVGYRFSKLITAAAMWRVLSLDYEGGADQDYFKYDMVVGGPGVVLGFHF